MPPETLHLVTLGICLFTLTLASAALMPQLKKALALVRDAMLGAVLVVALSFAGFLVWGRVLERSSWEPGAAEENNPPVFELSSLLPSVEDEALDPLPLPTIDDELASLPNR